jgi:hypothetical protein
LVNNAPPPPRSLMVFSPRANPAIDKTVIVDHCQKISMWIRMVSKLADAAAFNSTSELRNHSAVHRVWYDRSFYIRNYNVATKHIHISLACKI